MRRGRGDEDFFPVAPGIDGPLFAEVTGPPRPEPGPFDDSTEQPTPEEVLVAGMIWKHRGRVNAVAGEEIAQVTGIEPRFVKATVQALRDKHRCRIGSKHYDPPGYYWIVDDEDRRLAVGPFHSQMLAMWDTLQVLDTRANNGKLLERMKEKL